MRLIRSLVPYLLAIVLIAAPWTASAAVFVNVTATIAPPPLPVYAQPPIPGPGYFWTPGYWAWGPYGYYWVPGTWVLPPAVGLYWTPGYWAWGGGVYAWHAGYWGPHIGFYGGINYGFGYVGVGYVGGYWEHGVFAYNRSFNNIQSNTHITNVYNKTVVNNTNVTNVSFNGGGGGVVAQPTPQEQAAFNERHSPATAQQLRHEQVASGNHAMLASVNQGHPGIAATRRPGQFNGSGVVAAQGAPPHGQPPMRNANAPHHPPHPPGNGGGPQHGEQHP
jgi:hypothetical protein